VAFSLDNADRSFRRFCGTGDPAALGAVFDATATELLRIACHLAGNRADAEDLVQRTFLAAIESRAAYEPKRRALPWLIGILANHARQLRRERRTPRPLPIAGAPDPVASAADRELAERLVALRRDLGEPYGEVLRLHLEQGLDAKEIATSLQRPAGTVRTQLVRALARLRQRLPDGFLAGFAPFAGRSLDPLPGALGAMREVVLRAAHGAPAVVGVPLVVTGGWVVSKKVALLVSLFVAVLAFPVYVALQPAAPPVPSHEVASAADRTNGGAGAPLAANAEVGADERTPFAAPLAPAPGEPGFAAVRVRVRWREDGSPAAGIGVFAANGRGVTRRDAVTDADGAGELAHLRPGPWSIGCTFTERSEAVTLVAGRIATVELFAVRKGFARGRVVDEQGRPVAAARIWMSTGADLGHGHEVASTDAAGTFVVPVLRAHRIGARKAGHAPSRCVAVDVERPDEPIVLQLTHRGGTVAGTVRDRAGTPIPWAKVLFGSEHGASPPIDGRRTFVPRGIEVVTDARGAYCVDCVPAGLCEVRAWASGHGPFAGTFDVAAAGRGELDLVLAPGAVVAGIVRDTNAAPVAGVSLAWGAEHGFAWVATTSAADGSYRLEDLPEATVRIDARRGAVQRSTQVDAVAGVVRGWDPVFPIAGPIAGRVVGPRGEPLVELVVTGQNGGDPFAAVTDAEGRFRIEDAGADPVALEVAGEQSLLQVADVAPGTTDLVLRVDADRLPSAFVRGRLIDERGRPVSAQLAPWHADSLRVRYAATDPETGAFRLGPLRPGSYRLEAHSRELGARVVATPNVAPRDTLDLGDVLVATPATVVVTATANGRAVVSGKVVFRRVDARWFGQATIEQGEARHAQLPPGRYQVGASAHGVGGAAEIEVAAGSVVPVAIELQPVAPLQITLRDPRGVAMDSLDPTITASTLDGRFVALFFGPLRDTAARFAAELPAERIVVTAVTLDGRTATLEVDPGSAAAVGGDLVIELPR